MNHHCPVCGKKHFIEFVQTGPRYEEYFCDIRKEGYVITDDGSVIVL